jgi:hypothetical protein
MAIAADTDGALAIAWSEGTTVGIDLHDRSGALVRTIQTSRYRVTHLAFAEDHSLWTLGWQMDPSNPYIPDRSDYMIVRKFLPSGEQSGAYLPRSLFPRGLPPGEEPWQRHCITVAHDSVGFLVNSGMDSNKAEWVELDLNGKLTGRWRLDSFSYDLTVALTSDGHVFLNHGVPGTRNHALLTLDRVSSTWQPVQSAPNGRLVSSDGDALIFADNLDGGPIHLRWYQHP